MAPQFLRRHRRIFHFTIWTVRQHKTLPQKSTAIRLEPAAGIAISSYRHDFFFLGDDLRVNLGNVIIG